VVVVRTAPVLAGQDIGERGGVRGRRTGTQFFIGGRLHIFDQYAKARMNGSLDADQAQNVPVLKEVTENTIETLRRHQRDGPLEVTELATVLRALSRLQFAAMRSTPRTALSARRSACT
jgi:hypothetical protein